jgi:hypothetical protein
MTIRLTDAPAIPPAVPGINARRRSPSPVVNAAMAANSVPHRISWRRSRAGSTTRT